MNSHFYSLYFELRVAAKTDYIFILSLYLLLSPQLIHTYFTWDQSLQTVDVTVLLIGAKPVGKVKNLDT